MTQVGTTTAAKETPSFSPGDGTQRARRPLPQPPSWTSTITSAQPWKKVSWKDLLTKEGWKKLVSATKTWFKALNPLPFLRRVQRQIVTWWKANTPSQLVKKVRKALSAIIKKYQENLARAKTQAVAPVKKPPGMRVGEQHFFTFKECEHLIYLIECTQDLKVELLGFRYLSRGEGGTTLIQKIEELKGQEIVQFRRERESVETEGEGGVTPFCTMLLELREWIRTRVNDVYIFRQIDSSDVSLIVDYYEAKFAIHSDPGALNAFQTELEELKKRLATLLFEEPKKPKNLESISNITAEARQDIARFRHMLSFLIRDELPVDGHILQINQLHQYWDFWDTVTFLPENQLAIDLDLKVVPDADLYRGMRVDAVIS